jgi:peptidoglycan/xylan/chitin deacetylase (PgdA/CDA1 family)
MPSKKQILARTFALCGLTRVLESLPGRPSLLILNYHRIGDAAETPYDSGTFSATAAELDWQAAWLKRHYNILTLPQAVDLVHGRVKPKHTSVLITFDDGYLDNYAEAFPILRRHGVSATFFLPTAFIGTGALPWWDEIAFMVKQSPFDFIKLTYPNEGMFDLTTTSRPAAVVAVLRFFKQSPQIDTARFLNHLATASGCPRPTASAERCFLNWDEALDMQQAGMCFGSHTHTHEILGRLPYARQLDELQTSRRILEAELGGTIDTLAYPVGHPQSFSEETRKALREARYRTAFSFYSGVNVPGHIAPFDVLRAGVDGESRAVFRLRAAMYANAGRGLV